MQLQEYDESLLLDRHYVPLPQDGYALRLELMKGSRMLENSLVPLELPLATSL